MERIVRPEWPAGYTLRSNYARMWYSDHRIPFLDFLAMRTAAAILSLASPMSGAWIEIGCGPGGLLPTFLRAAELVAGVDIDMPSVQDAAILTRFMSGSSCALRASAYTTPFRDSSFDGVVAVETLEHLDAEPVAREIRRILKPGGKLVFSAPVEIGSALLVRQALRRLMRPKCSNFSPMVYPLADLVGMVTGRDKILHRLKRKASNFDHAYFSYRVLLDELAKWMKFETFRWSPFPIRGPWTFSITGVATKR